MLMQMLERCKKGEDAPALLHQETDQLHSAINNIPNISSIERHVYGQAAYFVQFIPIFKSLSHIRSLPASKSRTTSAEALLRRTIAIADDITDYSSPIISDLFSSGVIAITADDTPIKERYDFKDSNASVYLMYSTRHLIGLTRMMQTLHLLISGVAPIELEQRNQELCRIIWMQLAYIREEDRMSAILHAESFIVAYKCATGAIKQYLIEWIKEVGEYRGRTQGSAEDVDSQLLRLGAMLAGE